MAIKLHHIVLLVASLDIAIDDFKKAGFNVSAGGAHMGNISHNAIIPFQDQTYIELLAVKPGIPAIISKFIFKTRLHKIITKIGDYSIIVRFYGRAFNSKNGIIDYALWVDEQAQQQFKQRGFRFSKPFAAYRNKPDGDKVQWDMINTKIREFPFLIANIQPDMTFPTKATQHQNGAKGIENLYMIPEDFLYQVNQHHMFLGLAPDWEETEQTDFASFNLSGSAVTLIQEKEKPVIKEKIKNFGTRRFAIKLKDYLPADEFTANLETKYGLIPAQEFSRTS